MSRIDVIAKLAGKKALGGAYRPQGMSVAAGAEPTKAKAVYARLPQYPSMSFRAMRDDPTRLKPSAEWLRYNDLKEGACFKERRRHGAHHLTRIAERMKRGWH